jgi:hypothetical protein
MDFPIVEVHFAKPWALRKSSGLYEITVRKIFKIIFLHFRIKLKIIN